MTKRNLPSIILCLLLLLCLAGCSNSNSQSAAVKKDAPKVEQKNDSKNVGKSNVGDAAKVDSTDGSTANPGNNSDKPGNDLAPKNRQEMESSELFGQVKSISGSTIVLAIAQKPERTGEPPRTQPPAPGEIPNNQPPEQGEKPTGPPPEAGTQPELTGETKTITVQDGVIIESGSRGNSQELTIDQLKAGDMIEVFFTDSKANEVDRIRVMQNHQ